MRLQPCAVALAFALCLPGGRADGVSRGAAPRAPSAQPAPSQPAPGQPIFRTGVSLVRLDVTVTGPDDQPVADLAAEDFEVRENDAPRPIETFQFVRVTGEPVAGDDTSLVIRSPEHGAAEAARDDVRLFALFLDEYHITKDPPTTQRLRKALTDWVNTALQPTDVVVLMDPLTPLSALEFTRSKPDLLERIRKFEGRRGIYTPVRSVLEEGQLQARNVRRVRAEVTLSALAALVSHLGSLRERRSSVLFVSEGPPTWFADGDIEDRVRDVLEAANRSNVTINVFDPRGLTQAGVADILWRLSGETGGRAGVNSNDLGRGLALATRDASAYYLIGYPPVPDGADAFRRVDVKVRRKGLKVLARRGYWVPPAPDATPPTAPDVPAAVRDAVGVFAAREGHRAALTWWGFEPSGPDTARVRLAWQPVRPRDTARSGQSAGPEGKAPAPVVLGAVVQTSSGAVVFDQELVLPAGTPGLPAGATFDAETGPLKVLFTLLAADRSVLDRWTETVAVPAFAAGTAALGTPRLYVARSALEYRALVANPAAATPTPLREFTRTDRVVVEIPLRRPGTVTTAGEPAAPPFRAALLNRMGVPLVELPLAVEGEGARGTRVTRLELPLSSLAPGDYVLKVRLGEDDPGAQHAAFRVVP